MSPSKPEPERMSIAEIARLFGVKVHTVYVWNFRRQNQKSDTGRQRANRLDAFPEPAEYVVNNTPLWDRAAVVDWGVRTKRLSIVDGVAVPLNETDAVPRVPRSQRAATTTEGAEA